MSLQLLKAAACPEKTLERGGDHVTFCLIEAPQPPAGFFRRRGGKAKRLVQDLKGHFVKRSCITPSIRPSSLWAPSLAAL